MTDNKFNPVLVTISVVLFILTVAVFVWITIQKNSTLSDNLVNDSVKTDTVSKQEVLTKEFMASFNSNEELKGSVLITSAYSDSAPEVLAGDAVADKWDDYMYDVARDIVSLSDSSGDRYFVSQGTDDSFMYTGLPAVIENYGAYNSPLILEDAGEERQLEITDQLYLARLPRLSNDTNYYTYSSQQITDTSNIPDFQDIDTWHVSVGSTIDGQSEVYVIENAYNSQWAGNYVVYVKKDGLYARPVASVSDEKSEFLLLEAKDGEFSLRNHTGISNDGKYLAVSYPIPASYGESTVGIYKIGFTTDSTELIHTITLDSVDAFWPLFSPEGRYLSMQIRPKSLNDEENEIRIYDFTESDFVQSFDFSDYNFDTSFNTDWIN